MRVTNQLLRDTSLQSYQDVLNRMVVRQNQITSGKRVMAPSDDPVAVNTILKFQGQIERMGQYQKNIQEGIARLQTSDGAVGNVLELYRRAKAIAIDQADSAADIGDRAGLAFEVGEILSESVSIANMRLGTRYLFAGSKDAATPFEIVQGQFVAYNGNADAIRAYIDDGTMETVNLAGNEAFGALSAEVAGIVNLEPDVDTAAKLADLNRGRGVAAGSIRILDGLGGDVTLDLSAAEDLGDIIDTINTDPTLSLNMWAGINAAGNGLAITAINAVNLQVLDVAENTTAGDLGIRQETPLALAPLASLAGADLDPQLTALTPLTLLNGGAGINLGGGIVITNRNDSIVFQENVTFEGAQTVEDILNAVNQAGVYATARINDAGTGINIVSRLNGAEMRIADFRDSGTSTGGGTPVTLNDTTKSFTPGALVGATLVITSGTGAGQTRVIGANTQTSLTVTAAWGVGLEPDNTSTYEITGGAAGALGVSNMHGGTLLTGLNAGEGVRTVDDPLRRDDFRITLQDGTVIDVDVDGAQTVQDVIARINNDAQNPGPLTGLTASIQAVRRTLPTGIVVTENAIVLSDASVSTGTTFSIEALNGSDAAVDLGLVEEGDADLKTEAPAAPAGDPGVIAGRDVNPVMTDSFFTSLIRLKEGLLSGDVDGISRAGLRLEDVGEQLTNGRAVLGSRASRLNSTDARLKDQELQFQTLLAGLQDVDVAEAIMDLNNLKTNFEAILQTSGSMLQMTLAAYL
ncbi:MAG: flagellar hook-associated protein FlgL [Planctomycetota bacterium]